MSNTDAPPTPFDYQTYDPKPLVYYTSSSAEAASLISHLKSDDDVYGFDVEWRPNFIAGRPENPVALLQLASRECILLLHLAHMGAVPQELQDFLADATKRKAGVGAGKDAQKLFRDHGLRVNGVVDLSTCARQVDPTIQFTGLAKLAQRFLGKTVTKGRAQMSNWASKVLSPQQTQYAANDAFVARCLWESLKPNLPQKQPKKKRERKRQRSGQEDGGTAEKKANVSEQLVLH